MSFTVKVERKEWDRKPRIISVPEMGYGEAGLSLKSGQIIVRLDEDRGETCMVLVVDPDTKAMYAFPTKGNEHVKVDTSYNITLNVEISK